MQFSHSASIYIYVCARPFLLPIQHQPNPLIFFKSYFFNNLYFIMLWKKYTSVSHLDSLSLPYLPHQMLYFLLGICHLLTNLNLYIYCVLCSITSPPSIFLDYKLHKGRLLCLFSSYIYPKGLEQCLAYNRCSVNIFFEGCEWYVFSLLHHLLSLYFRASSSLRFCLFFFSSPL